MTTLSQLAVAIEEALKKLDPLHKGDEIGFICPSHNDSRPSARWHSEKRVWYCDVCSDGGGAVDLSKKLGVR